MFMKQKNIENCTKPISVIPGFAVLKLIVLMNNLYENNHCCNFIKYCVNG